MSRKVINVNGHPESWPEGTITPRDMAVLQRQIDIDAEVRDRGKQFFVNDARPAPYPTGGYIMPDFFFKELCRVTDFNRYWEMEARDLEWLIKRLESYER